MTTLAAPSVDATLMFASDGLGGGSLYWSTVMGTKKLAALYSHAIEELAAGSTGNNPILKSILAEIRGIPAAMEAERQAALAKPKPE